MALAMSVAVNFNPILVRFKHLPRPKRRGPHLTFQSYFSPIQTRVLEGLPLRSDEFQSYFSPIQTLRCSVSSWRDGIFQSYFSPIQTWQRGIFRQTMGNFNPILVRFKQRAQIKGLGAKYHFNPILVRFKRRMSLL